ncbi:5-oxoprolinase subunit PxpA [Mangrovibacterium diazotrophicum]|uniref:UPF0271 protein n=1 Tax=Mangrovibacterium diazotrophicum TaxID=1261403 RepID=A0A419W4S1_9BACT|nr:5-oxoprolinase subunit PxpA [Mangrovibacterium diazotrophicum]RKD90449.1 UPF0271 protein [Mangrovibacterium diazotrophicum]
MKILHVDLNCDLGEGIGNDAAVMPFISSANIACGYHAGNEMTMRETVLLAKKCGVSIGAHPGYDDKTNFGRTPMDLTASEAEELVFKQIKKLQKIAESEGCKLTHVKPHGALYNQAAIDINLASAIARAIYKADPKLLYVGLANSQMGEAAKAFQLQFVSEVFADRAYTDEGQLVSRQLDGAVIHDPVSCTSRVLQMVTLGTVESIGGKRIAIQADSICIHGDNPEAIALAKAIHDALVANDLKIEPITTTHD